VTLTDAEPETSIKRLQREVHAAGTGRWDLPFVGREQSKDTWHWFGNGPNGVIAGLCELLDRHRARGRGRLWPAAIGCVPWFNHEGIAERLASMPTCIVINKPKQRTSVAVRHLYGHGSPFHSEWLTDIRDLAPTQAGGAPRIVQPGNRSGSALGPVRVYGYRQDGTKPLLHTKMLVLGGTYEDDEYFSGIHFLPDVVWIGSANWTTEADTQHMEAAVAVADRSFVRSATQHIVSIISGSEPLGSYSATPSPNLAPSQLDMAAFTDYVADFLPRDEDDTT
jgi:hypothetical protein